jgi:hypothetical protein
LCSFGKGLAEPKTSADGFHWEIEFDAQMPPRHMRAAGSDSFLRCFSPQGDVTMTPLDSSPGRVTRSAQLSAIRVPEMS